MAAATAAPGTAEAVVSGLEVRACTVPTDAPESDGTLQWDATTIVIVEVEADGKRGLGYTYGDRSVAAFVDSKLRPLLGGADAMAPGAIWREMQREIRNAGRPGVGAMAVSAVDVALWDLKAKLLGVCLADALPRCREAAAVYGSGGFTSYSHERLQRQVEGWLEAGLSRAKIKVGRHPGRDRERLAICREAAGPEVELMVDANGAFDPKQALRQAEVYADYGVTWLEEPVSSEDRAGLAFVRERGPAGIEIAAGEYEWDLPRLGELASCVDVVQADVTRIGGITNMLRADGVCKARQRRFSAHCAPAISAHVCCAMETFAHLEYFHDHVRVEGLLFEGTLEPRGGRLAPDRSRPGLGLELNADEAARHAA